MIPALDDLLWFASDLPGVRNRASALVDLVARLPTVRLDTVLARPQQLAPFLQPAQLDRLVTVGLRGMRQSRAWSWRAAAIRSDGSCSAPRAWSMSPFR